METKYFNFQFWNIFAGLAGYLWLYKASSEAVVVVFGAHSQARPGQAGTVETPHIISCCYQQTHFYRQLGSLPTTVSVSSIKHFSISESPKQYLFNFLNIYSG